HCGEYLTDDRPEVLPQTGPSDELSCDECEETFDTSRNLYLHGINVHGVTESQGDQPVWRFGGVMWRCTAHDKTICRECQAKLASPRKAGKTGDVWLSSKPSVVDRQS